MRTTYQRPLEGSKGVKPVDDESPILCGVFATHVPPLQTCEGNGVHDVECAQVPQLFHVLRFVSQPLFTPLQSP